MLKLQSLYFCSPLPLPSLNSKSFFRGVGILYYSLRTVHPSGTGPFDIPITQTRPAPRRWLPVSPSSGAEGAPQRPLNGHRVSEPRYPSPPAAPDASAVCDQRLFNDGWLHGSQFIVLDARRASLSHHSS